MILLLSITCALVGASTLSACDGGPESAESGGADPIAIVTSIRSNQQTLNPLSSTEIVSMIDAHMGGTYFMISADGVPRLVSRVDTRPTAKNDSAREYERQGFVQPILAAMLTPASTPETDLLKSLALAVGALEGAPVVEPREEGLAHPLRGWPRPFGGHCEDAPLGAACDDPSHAPSLTAAAAGPVARPRPPPGGAGCFLTAG